MESKQDNTLKFLRMLKVFKFSKYYFLKKWGMNMKTGLKLIAIFMSACFIIFLTGCGIGAIISQSTTFQGNYEIEIVKPHADMLNVIAEVGKSMGYRVSALDVKGDSISISSESSMAGMIIGIGTINDITITATIMDSGKKIEVLTMLMGNFGVGTKEESDKIFNDFKTRLLVALSKK